MAQIFEPSETAVGNLALSHLRIPKRITSIDDDTTKEAKELRLHFSVVRDGLQRQYQWNFCEEDAALTAIAGDIPHGFSYLCALPPDCLFVRQVIGCGANTWKVVRSRQLAVKVRPPLTLRYSKCVVEVPYWDALFINAFALHLAVACAPVLAEDESLKADLRDAARDALFTAFPPDSAEGVPDEIPDTPWVTCR